MYQLCAFRLEICIHLHDSVSSSWYYMIIIIINFKTTCSLHKETTDLFAAIFYYPLPSFLFHSVYMKGLIEQVVSCVCSFSLAWVMFWRVIHLVMYFVAFYFQRFTYVYVFRCFVCFPISVPCEKESDFHGTALTELDYYLGARNWTQILWKGSQCSYLLSQLPIPQTWF